MTGHVFTPIPIAEAFAAGKGDIKAQCIGAEAIQTGANRDGKTYRRRNVTLADESGQVTGVCWDRWIDVVQPGGTYAISNPLWKDWKGQRNCTMSMYCAVERLDAPGQPNQPPPQHAPMHTSAPGAPPAGFTPAGGSQSPPPPPQQPPPPLPAEEPEQPPPEGPNDKNVLERVKLYHYWERDIVAELYRLDDGVRPSAPRVGMYLKMIADEYARSQWRRPRTNGNGKKAKANIPPKEGGAQ